MENQHTRVLPASPLFIRFEMAEISANAGGRYARKGRKPRGVPKMDMTPMVDLAFLLLTFFVLTSVFAKPAVLQLTFPVDGKPSPLKNILTVVADKSDTVYYYYGMMDSSTQRPFKAVSYGPQGIRKIMAGLNKDAIAKINAIKGNDAEAKHQRERIAGDKTSLTVLIKTCDDARYARVINLLDETDICGISKKAVVDLTKREKLALEKQKGSY
jgi:hypothetical protein